MNTLGENADPPTVASEIHEIVVDDLLDYRSALNMYYAPKDCLNSLQCVAGMLARSAS